MAVKEELDKLIRQILGDFPEGFNAGASAGLLGWPGDMAMMADTARLALSGERSQRPPEEYPLTTDDFVDDDEAADLIGRARAAAEKALK